MRTDGAAVWMGVKCSSTGLKRMGAHLMQTTQNLPRLQGAQLHGHKCLLQ